MIFQSVWRAANVSNEKKAVYLFVFRITFSFLSVTGAVKRSQQENIIIDFSSEPEY